MAVTAEEIIHVLSLEPHVEGGYYRRTYQAETQPRVSTPGGERHAMTSIHYLLTAAAPVGHFHRNRSDIVHYFHMGDPVRYHLIHRDGRLEQVDMGHDLGAGQRLQLTVAGGVWKASELLARDHGYGLISEAVTPGFDFADMTLAEREPLAAAHPEHTALIRRLTRK